MSRAERRALIEREDPALRIFQQCRLLAVSRSSVYRRPAEVSEEDGAIMALIDRQYLNYITCGYSPEEEEKAPSVDLTTRPSEFSSLQALSGPRPHRQ